MNDPESIDEATTVLVVRHGRRVSNIPCRPGETILQTLRRANIHIPTQCERAYCGSCMFQLLQGEVVLRFNDVLSDADLAEGVRLACQGIATGPLVEIELS